MRCTPRGESSRIQLIELFPQWIKDCKYKQLNSLGEIREALESIPVGSSMALDTETTGLDRMRCKLLGFSFTNQEGSAYWVPVKTGQELSVLNEYVKDRICLFYNAGYDIPVLERHHVMINKFEDMMCLVFMDNPNARMRGLKEAGRDILNLDTVELKDLFPGKKVKIQFDLLDPTVKVLYGCQDADLTWRLFQELSHLKTQQAKIWGLEMALVRPNFEMEMNGVDIDIPFLAKSADLVKSKILKYRERIFELAGHQFEINSNAQIAKVLYEELGLVCPKLTPKGSPKVDKDTLALIKTRHPILQPLMEIGTLENKLSSCIEKWPTILHPDTGRLHCHFIQWNVPTGRYASSDPNLQNVPKSLTKEEKESYLNIRNAFVANAIEEANVNPGLDDFLFLDCDYSQIELRVAASMSGEPVWFGAYSGNLDVHADTAKKIFKVPTPSDDQRSKAKTGNFGILYGQSGYSFAMKQGMPKEEGEAFVQAWFAALPVLTQWIKVEKEKSRRSGVATTFFGRRRPMIINEMNGINCADRKMRQFWERSVISHICQGTAADLMKLALVLIRKAIKENGYQNDIFPLLTVHDQILFKVRVRKVEEAKKLIREVMELKVSGFCPLTIDMKIGTRWGSCVDLSKWSLT